MVPSENDAAQNGLKYALPVTMSRPKIPKIPEEERTPLVVALLEIIRLQQEQIQELRDGRPAEG